MNMSKAILPMGPASAGERSCWGTGALLNVSNITVLWSAEPEIRTLSMAQSFWSRPSCRGCHQRKRVAISLASVGRRIFTNLTENKEDGKLHSRKYSLGFSRFLKGFSEWCLSSLEFYKDRFALSKYQCGVVLNPKAIFGLAGWQ